MNKLRKFSRAILAIAIMLCVALPTLAHDFEVGGIYYNYLDKTAKTVKVTYKGDDYDSYRDEYTGNVAIPSSVTYDGTTYSVTEIGSSAFRNCTGLTSITIPNSVTSIGSCAFSRCSGLTSITIPNSVTSIGSSAFYECSGLTSVTIPNSVTEIGNMAFEGCTGLTSITIPNSVTSIGAYAFKDCTGLTSITIPNSVTSIGASAFTGTAWYNNLADGVIYINNFLYKYKGSMPNGTSISVKDGTVSICPYAFYGCTGLTSITIPNSVTEIGSAAFYDCTGLTSVTIGNSVTEIGVQAFYGCRGLTSVTIPNSVTSIGNYAFEDCTGLTSVCIGNSVTSIGDEAFYNCWGLRTIISLNTTPPVCANSNSFYNYSSATLYVPKDSYAKYFIDDVWGQFTNIKKIEILVSSITLNNSTIELDKGNTATISATIAPSNATIKNIVWTSSNPQIATVDQSGKVTALTPGIATITAMANDGSNVSASCKVVVKEVETKITLSQTEANLPVNDIMTLSYEVIPLTTPVEWSTSNENVAYIKKNADNSVTVLGMADGVAIITAKALDGSGVSASCVVTVGVGGVEGVEMDNNAIEVARYDIHGRLLSEPTPGINIVKMSNGTTRKEIVKN